jgi:hypothetical protein
MTPAGDDWRFEQVLALVAGEPLLAGDSSGTAGWMQQLCRAAARHLPACGVGVSLESGSGNQVAYAASDATCERIEELQFTLGEGPGLDAYSARRPVLSHDLGDPTTPWPAFAVAAHDHGVRACFAFPLQIGAARLGALVIYRDTSGPLPASGLRLALAFAAVALGGLLDTEHEGGALRAFQEDHGDTRFERYQAQGMVMVQLGVDLAQAMARIRAHAYATDRRLTDVADDIVAGKLTLEPDGA